MTRPSWAWDPRSLEMGGGAMGPASTQTGAFRGAQHLQAGLGQVGVGSRVVPPVGRLHIVFLPQAFSSATSLAGPELPPAGEDGSRGGEVRPSRQKDLPRSQARHVARVHCPRGCFL